MALAGSRLADVLVVVLVVVLAVVLAVVFAGVLAVVFVGVLTDGPADDFVAGLAGVLAEALADDLVAVVGRTAFGLPRPVPRAVPLQRRRRFS